MKLYSTALFSLAILAASWALVAQKSEKSMDEIRVVPVNSTPEPTTVLATIQLPREGAVLKGNSPWIQVRVDGYALGSDSQFDRRDEIVNSKLGQTLRVIIDNDPFFPINGPSIEPFNDDGWYYNQNYKFQVPYKLKEGFHFLRVFLARSFGEGLEGARTFHSSWFFIGQKENEAQAKYLTAPFITYNEPCENTALVQSKPVLLDFYVNNCELSADGYKVRLIIDKTMKRTLTTWRPYYIYGLKKGKHTIRLELIDSDDELVKGPFNDTERQFTIS